LIHVPGSALALPGTASRSAAGSDHVGFVMRGMERDWPNPDFWFKLGCIG
jgi:hypothetical protein